MTDHVWHHEVIGPTVEQTLKALKERSLLEGFYLAGGTGLALQLGHRRSLDLDFFRQESFNDEQLLQQLQRFPEFSLTCRDRQTLHVRINGVKVSFLGYDYPVLFPFSPFLEVPVADPKDIGSMKISAIAGRGTRRDFVDLYMVARQEGLKALLDLFQRKFAEANYNRVHVLKSLTYFDDADAEPMPNMLVPLVWPEVKDFFREQTPGLL